jgi:hypothetical protein
MQTWHAAMATDFRIGLYQGQDGSLRSPQTAVCVLRSLALAAGRSSPSAGQCGGWLVLDDGDPDLDKYTKDNPLRDRGFPNPIAGTWTCV